MIIKNQKTTYILIWDGEIIEEDIIGRKEALYLKKEYQMAYGGIVSMKIQRKRK